MTREQIANKLRKWNEHRQILHSGDIHQLSDMLSDPDPPPHKRTHFETDGCDPPLWQGPTGE